MKAIILCAGYGTRMKPYTDIYQKVMIPLHGKPLLEYIIEGISFTGIKDFVIVVGYHKDQIINFFQDGTARGLRINYIEQKNLNGTGGALLLCEKLIHEDHFFLTWGDTLSSYAIYKEVYNVFTLEKPNFILVTNYVEDPYKGAAVYCEGNYCADIIEKPPKGTSKTNLNNTGMFILSTEIFNTLKKLKPSTRGELEVPEAIRMGIKEQNWKFRIVKLEKTMFMGDFGNKEVYEKYKDDTKWLELLYAGI